MVTVVVLCVRAGLISGVCCGGQDSLLRITDQEQCLFSQIKPDNGVGFHVNISLYTFSAMPCPALYNIIIQYIATIMLLSELV